MPAHAVRDQATGSDSALAEAGRRLAAGERQAFDVVVRELWEPVMRFLWKRVPADDAQDLAQSVFTAAYRAVLVGAGPAAHDRESWRRYLLAGARNHWIDFRRRSAASAEIASLDALLGDETSLGERLPDRQADAPSAERLISAEQQGALRDCLARLEARERALCWLHFMDGVSKREIARTLEQPEATVRVWLTKALAALRTCLSSKGHAP